MSDIPTNATTKILSALHKKHPKVSHDHAGGKSTIMKYRKFSVSIEPWSCGLGSGHKSGTYYILSAGREEVALYRSDGPNSILLIEAIDDALTNHNEKTSAEKALAKATKEAKARTTVFSHILGRKSL